MFFQKKKKQLVPLLPELLPKHIGIIMDGNGRWAKKRGLPRSVGHREGAKTFRKIANYCASIGIRYLTVYAFSTENWSRPKEEVDGIMDLLRDYLQHMFEEKEQRDHIRVQFIGDRTPLARDIQKLMAEAEQETCTNTDMVLNIAINYGGRDEILHSVRQLCQLVKKGTLEPEQITQESISHYLYTADQPDPDLIIRPSGELRTSNFLVWQGSYSELIFLDVLWPDFTPEHLQASLREYASRNRRFGGI